MDKSTPCPPPGRGAPDLLEDHTSILQSVLPMPHSVSVTLGLAGAALLSATAWLWVSYGGGVYADAILTGIAGCF